MPRRPSDESDVNRFGSFIDRTSSEVGCWLWVGNRDRHGYGEFITRRSGVKKYHRAHRWSFELHRGPIPEGLVLDHLCRVRNCVNPDHLEAVTGAENTARGGNAIKTHCPKGHPYSGDNLAVRYVTYKGKRYQGRGCKACSAEALRQWRKANRTAS